jgi:predicted Zn-dependent protease
VLKHEFVHVVNLQQTDFNIPHWFTEALAVLSEESPRPDKWNALLVKNSAAGKLFNLDNINLGFIRPLSSDEWTLAYCQAELYAEYMLDRFGPDALAKMLSAYGNNLTTTEAIRQAFGVEQPDFERGYQAHVAKIVSLLPATAEEAVPSLADVQKALLDKPDDPQLLAQLALAQLNRKNYPEARRRADAALKLDPRQQLAHYVRARLHLLVGENQEAFDRLKTHLNRSDPQPNLLALLAGLQLRSEDFTAAAELYELGAKHEPGSNRWLKSLAAVYLKSGENDKLRPILEKLAEADPDDLALRKKLAQLAIEQEDFAAADRWTLEGLHIQVLDANLHAWRAMALGSLEQPEAAAEEFAVAVELSPDEPQLRISHAEALIAADRRAEARAVLKELLKRDAGNESATKLLKSLE